MRASVKRRPGIGAFVLLALFMGMDACAQGTAGFEVLWLQTQPRGSALAGALIADEGHVECTFYNPAGLTVLPARTAAAGYMNYLLDIQSGYAAYVDPTLPWGIFGVTLTYTNYGDFDGRSTTGEALPTFSASDIVLSAVYARQVKENFSLGGAFKFVHSDIEDYTAQAIALDIGGQYTIIEEKLRLGAGIFNMGGTVKAYDNYKDDLPLYYRVGIWGVPEGLPAKLYFSMTMYHEYADNYSLGSMNGSSFLDFLGDFYYGIGAEFNPVEVIWLRFGFDTIGLDQRVDTRKDTFAGISVGFGIDATLFKMDYGLASHGELGFVQRISLSKEF